MFLYYWCLVALENNFDQKLSSHFLICKKSGRCPFNKTFGMFAGRMERVRPLARNRGHVLCNTGHAGLCLKVAQLLSILVASKQDECETISCTIFDSNDDVILLAAVACYMRRDLTRVNEYFEVSIPAYFRGSSKTISGSLRKRVSY